MQLQETTTETLVKIEAVLDEKADFYITDIDLDEIKFFFEDEEVTEDDDGGQITYDEVSKIYKRTEKTIEFLILIHSKQRRITDIYEYGRVDIIVEIKGYDNVLFYQEMLLISEQALIRNEFTNSFLFARFAYESWLSQVVDKKKMDKSWETKFELYYHQKASNKLRRFARIRDNLVHGKSAGAKTDELMTGIDCMSQLKMISSKYETLNTIVQDWEHESKFKDVNINKLGKNDK